MPALDAAAYANRRRPEAAGIADQVVEVEVGLVGQQSCIGQNAPCAPAASVASAASSACGWMSCRGRCRHT